MKVYQFVSMMVNSFISTLLIKNIVLCRVEDDGSITPLKSKDVKEEVYAFLKGNTLITDHESPKKVDQQANTIH